MMEATAQVAEDRLAIGGNVPPTDLEIEIEALRTSLLEEHANLFRRADDLLARVEYVPDVIDNGDDAARATDFEEMLKAAAKALEGQRITAKEPHRARGAAVDGVFVSPRDACKAAKININKRVTAFDQRVAAAEKLRREEEARLQREEAERAAKEAAEKAALAQSERDLDEAIAAEARAKQAAADAIKAKQAADAKAADMSRARTDHGAVRSLVTRWVFEIDDPDALPLDMLRPHIHPDDLRKAVGRFVKAGGRELAGARIFESTETVVRRS